MKTTKAIIFLVVMGQSFGCLAQTNTFPASGNVGIGVTPASKLHVKGGVRFERPDALNYVMFHMDSGGDYMTSDDPGTNQKNLFLRVVSSPLTDGARHLYIQSGVKDQSFVTRMIVRGDNGNVGIGTNSPQAKLAVNGNILAKEIKIKTDITVPDYVFKAGYKLPTLAETDEYIKQNGHLPDVPSAQEIKRDGLDLAAMNLLLLKKVEELTLHLIAKGKEVEKLKSRMDALEKDN